MFPRIFFFNRCSEIDSEVIGNGGGGGGERDKLVVVVRENPRASPTKLWCEWTPLLSFFFMLVG